MIVTARFEINEKAAPHLEALLRDSITPQIRCTLLEVSSHEQQVLQQGHGAVEAVWGGESTVETEGVRAEPVDAGEVRELAWDTGQGRSESRADAVPEEERDLTPEVVPAPEPVVGAPASKSLTRRRARR